MTGWLLRFARRCTEREHARGTRALARLGQRTFTLQDQFANDGVAFVAERGGMLAVAERPGTAERFLRGLAVLREFGFSVPDRVITGAEARAREPLLSGAAAAAVAVEQHVQVDPLTLVHGLADHLRAVGVAIEPGRAVRTIARGPRGAVVSAAGGPELRADHVVVAAGAWSGPLLRRVGVRVPIAAGKGYSFEVQQPGAVGPRSSILLLDAHVGVSPLPGRVRLAGTMEFSGLNARIDTRRTDAIARSVQRLLPGLAVERRSNLWAGMRPIAPDGLPVIDRLPGPGNVYLAGAYSMLGMTLAAPAGEALAEMILSGRRPAVLEPFRIDRFATVRGRVSRR